MWLKVKAKIVKSGKLRGPKGLPRYRRIGSKLLVMAIAPSLIPERRGLRYLFESPKLGFHVYEVWGSFG